MNKTIKMVGSGNYPRPSIMERFESKYIPVTESGCWIWIDSITHNGYGRIVVGNKTKRAHRVSWELYRGPIPKGMCVLHRCDVPSCVNPNHLFLGTQIDNVADMVSKGRSAKQEGKDNGYAKLTEIQVREIRESRESKKILADRYGVHIANIYYIKARKTWKHL